MFELYYFSIQFILLNLNIIAVTEKNMALGPTENMASLVMFGHFFSFRLSLDIVSGPLVGRDLWS